MPAASARFRGSSTATPIRRSAEIGWTSSRSARPARATRSCTLPAAGSSRPSRRRARPEKTGSDTRRRAPPRLDAARRARRPSRASRGTGSIARPSSRRSGRSLPPAGSRPGSARTPSLPSTTTQTRTSTSVLADVLPEAAHAGRGRGRLPRARRVRRDAGAPLPRSVRRRRARAAPARRPVHGGRRDPTRDRARRALRRSPGGDRSATESRRSRRATSRACSCRRAPSSSTGRCHPRARSSTRGAAIALATDFNPGSSFCESLPLVCSLAATQLKLSPAESLAACTVNAAHVLGRAQSIGRIAPGYRADIVLLDAPDWRYLAYHLGGPVISRVVKDGVLR